MTGIAQLHADVLALNPVLRRDFRIADPLHRYVDAIAEEAGEVMGAYNKWQDGRTDKPKGPDDIMAEMAQVIGCCFLAALHLGHNPAELLERTHRFMRDKAAGVNGEGYTLQPAEGGYGRCSPDPSPENEGAAGPGNEYHAPGCAHEPEGRELSLDPARQAL